MWLYLAAQLAVPAAAYVGAIAYVGATGVIDVGSFLLRSWPFPAVLGWFAFTNRCRPQRWFAGCAVAAVITSMFLYLTTKSLPPRLSEVTPWVAGANVLVSPLLGLLAATLARRSMRADAIGSPFELWFRLRDGKGRVGIGTKFVTVWLFWATSPMTPRMPSRKAPWRARLVDIRYMYEHELHGDKARVALLRFDTSPGKVLVVRVSRPRAVMDEYWDLPLDDPAHVADVIRQRQALAQVDGP